MLEIGSGAHGVRVRVRVRVKVRVRVRVSARGRVGARTCLARG